MSDPVFGYKIIDHTADLAIRVDGETLPDIYRFCAMGMFDCLVGLEGIRLDQGERIEVSGLDLEDLLVRMLSELLFRFSTRKLIFREFIIEYLTHEKLTFYARGETLDPDRHSVRTEIKAATYHGLRIEPTDDGFSTIIVFDV